MEGDVIVPLLELTQRLSQDAPLEEHLHAVTETALRLLPCDHASIRVVDGTGDELLANARSGAGARRRAVRMKKGEGVAGCVPLVYGGRPIGIFSVSSPEPCAFTSHDELTARLLANCSVPAIDRARLARLAVTDDLTLAYNARYLEMRLREEVERARRSSQPLSVAMLDLDHFKRVNDTFGHTRGDVVLRVVADRVRDNTRKIDVLTRRGGEEFLLILPATDKDPAMALAERVRHAVGAEPIEVTPGTFLVQTVSIGLATLHDEESMATLVDRADMAMYEAKRLGRDKVVAA
jgi:diguanylate cyclase (GGDEF)-like protein